jgi:hypothetical protein
MVGQEAHGWWAYAENTIQTWEMTVQVSKRDTFASTAITAFGNEGESPAGYFGIIRSSATAARRRFSRTARLDCRATARRSFARR